MGAARALGGDLSVLERLQDMELSMTNQRDRKAMYQVLKSYIPTYTSVVQK
jgi:hypothetical protein